MNPDGQVELRHDVEQRRDLGCVERHPFHVGESLSAARAELTHRTAGLGDEAVGRVHRQGRDEAREPLRVFLAELGHTVVRGSCESLGHVGLGLFIGFLLGAISGVYLLVAGKHDRRTKIPFGPFLAMGAVVAIVAGDPLIDAYLNV